MKHIHRPAPAVLPAATAALPLAANAYTGLDAGMHHGSPTCFKHPLMGGRA